MNCLTVLTSRRMTTHIRQLNRVPASAAGTPALPAQFQGALVERAFVDLNNAAAGHCTSFLKPTRRTGLYHSLFGIRQPRIGANLSCCRWLGHHRLNAFSMEEN